MLGSTKQTELLEDKKTIPKGWIFVENLHPWRQLRKRKFEEYNPSKVTSLLYKLYDIGFLNIFVYI